MNVELRTLLSLVKNALVGQTEQPKQGSMEQICKLAAEHQIEAMVCDAAIRCGISKQEPGMQELVQRSYRAMVKSEMQMASLQALYQGFEQAGVDYLPLKGCIMKPMYPAAEMRAMNDADILIRVEQYEKIKPVLEQLGFRFLAESDCELKWVSKGLYLELHKRLIPSFIKDFYAYFGDGWQLAVPTEGTRYVMCPEDEFLFIFTHFARHYREGGVGIRHMADIWYYRQKNPNLNEQKIVEVLKTLSLEQFYKNIQKTLANWFEDGEETQITAKITEYVTSGGSFGSEENKIVAQGVGKGGKAKTAAKLVFPPLDQMQFAYPVLKKHPALLPVMWSYRWVKVLTVDRNKIRVRQEQLKTMDRAKLDAFEESMRAVGINTDFEER